MNELKWRETWDKMQKPRKRPIRIGHDLEIHAKFDEDASIIGKYNNYEYMRRKEKIKIKCLNIGGPNIITVC